MMSSPSAHLSLQTWPPGPLDWVMKRIGVPAADAAAAVEPLASVPAGPGGPGGPAGPAGPCAPGAPCAPATPCLPSGPGGPCLPSGPAGPCFPSAPAGPAMPTGPAGPCSPLAPGGPAGPSKQPPNDNARPQATTDTKTRVLMLPPTPFACVEFFIAIQSEGTRVGVNPTLMCRLWPNVAAHKAGAHFR